jgi:hypothetical protein
LFGGLRLSTPLALRSTPIDERERRVGEGETVSSAQSKVVCDRKSFVSEVGRLPLSCEAWSRIFIVSCDCAEARGGDARDLQANVFVETEQITV